MRHDRVVSAAGGIWPGGWSLLVDERISAAAVRWAIMDSRSACHVCISVLARPFRGPEALDRRAHAHPASGTTDHRQSGGRSIVPRGCHRVQRQHRAGQWRSHTAVDTSSHHSGRWRHTAAWRVSPELTERRHPGGRVDPTATIATASEHTGNPASTGGGWGVDPAAGIATASACTDIAWTACAVARSQDGAARHTGDPVPAAVPWTVWTGVRTKFGTDSRTGDPVPAAVPWTVWTGDRRKFGTARHTDDPAPTSASRTARTTAPVTRAATDGRDRCGTR